MEVTSGSIAVTSLNTVHDKYPPYTAVQNRTMKDQRLQEWDGATPGGNGVHVSAKLSTTSAEDCQKPRIRNNRDTRKR